MLYVIIWEGLPLHVFHGRCAVRYDNTSSQGAEWHELIYEPGPTDAKVKVVAATVAMARAALGLFCGLDDRDNVSRPTRWIAADVGAPPPPDWPGPAAVGPCPECKGTGRVPLFTSYGPCKTCGANPCPSS